MTQCHLDLHSLYKLTMSMQVFLAMLFSLFVGGPVTFARLCKHRGAAVCLHLECVCLRACACVTSPCLEHIPSAANCAPQETTRLIPQQAPLASGCAM